MLIKSAYVFKHCVLESTMQTCLLIDLLTDSLSPAN